MFSYTHHAITQAKQQDLYRLFDGSGTSYDWTGWNFYP